jgi:hypothetical protein
MSLVRFNLSQLLVAHQWGAKIPQVPVLRPASGNDQRGEATKTEWHFLNARRIFFQRTKNQQLVFRWL